ncbi:MAG: hypothetical protein JWO89_3611 [Verrucomicrobiaceae bacterium]|nr:hypothetical protein [Verrucomicrobiaceae bacterium]
MLMSDVLMWVAIASGFVVGLPALWMLSRGLWPVAFEKRCAAAKRGMVGSLFLGLIPALFFSFLIALMAKRLGPVPGIIISSALIVWGLNGVVGIASIIGERLWPAGDPWKQTRNGGLVVICCALIPIVGWFLFLPLMALVGMGVNVRCLFMRRQHMAAEQASSSLTLDAPVGTPN